jgi:hypothetical protein
MTEPNRPEHSTHQQPLETLVESAVEKLTASARNIQGWAEKVRPKDGQRGRFPWALQTTRDANVASTAYLLGAFRRIATIDAIATPDDRKAGIEWVESMHIGNQQYRDPALMSRKTPGWPEGEPWPSPAMLEGINGYARSVLAAYKGEGEDLPPATPPPGWPQVQDAQQAPEKVLEWIRTRPWDTNPWGAGSHAMRMARYLLQWHKEGQIPIEPAIQALKFFYRIQNPETGLWGGPNTPKFQRINGTFKLFPLIREALDLPLPHADKVVDQVMDEFYRPDYDDHLGACDEWDNWYVIAHALGVIPGYRQEELRKLAAWRINRVLEIFSKPDGGLSYSPTRCATNWIGFDMAPSLPQSDVMGPGILACGINVCIDLLGVHDRTSWTGQWRMGKKEAPELRAKIIDLVFGS